MPAPPGSDWLPAGGGTDKPTSLNAIISQENPFRLSNYRFRPSTRPNSDSAVDSSFLASMACLLTAGTEGVID